MKTVKVPPQFEPIFKKAQDYVLKYFSKKKESPDKGTIEIFGQRYILVRAASMSVDFFETIRDLYRSEGEEKANNIARSWLFDIARAIGRMDAKNFHKQMNVTDPIEKLSAGPVHFAYTGWAFVDISPESRPTPDENYFLLYDHPFSFESDAWEKAGKKSDFPVCVMNAGYSSGWCEESFGIPLVAVEILCKAKGDDVCRFIMAHPSKIDQHIQDYIKKDTGLAKKITKYEIPGFFDNERMLIALKESEKKFKDVALSSADWIWEVDVSGKYTYASEKVEEILGYAPAEIIGKTPFDTMPKEEAERVGAIFGQIAADKKSIIDLENWNITKGNKRICMLTNGVPVLDKDGNLKGYRGVDKDITVQKLAQKEAADRLQDLEDFHKLAVGRELKMAELEKKIEELEAENARLRK
ncbi:MAG: PAS domain S-box protein [Candidatus Margulisiibacteriota bacterium]